MHDRVRAAIFAGACVVLGLLSRSTKTGLELWDKSFGDFIYPVMFGFLLRVVWPRMPAARVGLGAFGICMALELFQITGIPATFPRPLRFVFGTTFAWHDVACYVAGGLAVTALLSLESRLRRSA